MIHLVIQNESFIEIKMSFEITCDVWILLRFPTNDIWIAASAMEHGLELVSCDRDFLAVKQIMTHFVG